MVDRRSRSSNPDENLEKQLLKAMTEKLVTVKYIWEDGHYSIYPVWVRNCRLPNLVAKAHTQDRIKHSARAGFRPLDVIESTFSERHLGTNNENMVNIL